MIEAHTAGKNMPYFSGILMCWRRVGSSSRSISFQHQAISTHSTFFSKYGLSLKKCPPGSKGLSFSQPPCQPGNAHLLAWLPTLDKQQSFVFKRGQFYPRSTRLGLEYCIRHQASANINLIRGPTSFDLERL